MKDLLLFGASGSIGGSTLSVLREHPDQFALAGLAVNSSTHELADWIAEFAPRQVAIDDVSAREAWRESHPDLAARYLLDGPAEALLDLTAHRVLNAVTGFAGLKITLEAVERGLDVALANKESLVCGGSYLLERVAGSSSHLLPVDSEHAALFQLLEGRDPNTVDRLILTASGGPFWKLPAGDWSSITPVQALRHPTWKMGPRITIDSATLFNKGLEVIEAAMLFDMPEGRIEVLVHPQSQVHALLALKDGSTLAQMAAPDMRLPIHQMLAWPEKAVGEYGRNDFGSYLEVSFEPVDNDRFPSLGLARQCLRQGGTSALALNAADEVAVAAFLDGRLDFPGIFQTVEAVLDAGGFSAAGSWTDLLAADQRARNLATEYISAPSGRAKKEADA